jgi:jacalin-like lectin domain-containing protein
MSTNEGPWGGHGGNPFNDLESIGQPQPITGVTVYWDSNTIRGILTTYANGQTVSHGTTTGNLSSQGLSFRQGNEPVQITGTIAYGPGPFSTGRVGQLTFITAQKQSFGPYPESLNPEMTNTFEFVSPTQSGAYIGAFFGQSGLDLDAIGIVLNT